MITSSQLIVQKYRILPQPVRSKAARSADQRSQAGEKGANTLRIDHLARVEQAGLQTFDFCLLAKAQRYARLEGAFVVITLPV
ncbi:hypothetical protein ACEWPL_018880 [Roseovarius sp. S1116L3]|uniref:hypothetical protein n=1 Tax=Roseovarius roseus TaxID=3342636 RepID=UPI0037272C84